MFQSISRRAGYVSTFWHISRGMTRYGYQDSPSAQGRKCMIPARAVNDHTCSPCVFHLHASFQHSSSKIELQLSNPSMGRYLDNVLDRYEQAHKSLLDGDQTCHRIVSELSLIATQYKAHKVKQQELDDLKTLIKELPQNDEMCILAKEDIKTVSETLDDLEERVLAALLPYERGDDCNVVFEVKAGVGGQEAMLFSAEMFDMYNNYATWKGWDFNIINYDPSDLGGVRWASASIQGEDVYKTLKYESGVHRIQRVPKTEKAGRVHTSTTAVSVLPQPNEIEVNLNPKDLKVDTFRASGKGGQHVNTTDSAVRITHLPSGLVAECQRERSQMKNKEIALDVLRSRIYEKELNEQHSMHQNMRRINLGSGGRSEKIRTYNSNQDRITDHRISLNYYNLNDFMSGTDHLDGMIQELHQEARKERILALIANY